MSDNFPFRAHPLPYDYIALTPYCDPDTLYLHHQKIYGGYVAALNALLAEYPQYHDWSIPQLIFGDLQLPVPAKNQIRHCAGGIFNHTLYFRNLCGDPGEQPFGKLGEALHRAYGSTERFMRLFHEAAHSLLGPGWVWLTAEQNGTPHIVISQSNNTPSLDSLYPIFVADTWEHAYFLCYPARLDEYLTAWFRTLDWVKAEKNYQRLLLSANGQGETKQF